MIDAVFLLLAAFDSQDEVNIPERVYSRGKGTVNLCLHEEKTIEEFRNWIRREPSLSPGKSNERFEVFNSSEEPIRQYVLTRPSEPAHPAITCRRVFIGEDDTTQIERSMSCFAEKAACDRLFSEFHALDEQLKAWLRE